MLTPEQYRARGAFIRFQHALYNLEQELKPLEMSIECRAELDAIGRGTRAFFMRANQELFPRIDADIQQVTSKKGGTFSR